MLKESNNSIKRRRLGYVVLGAIILAVIGTVWLGSRRDAGIIFRYLVSIVHPIPSQPMPLEATSSFTSGLLLFPTGNTEIQMGETPVAGEILPAKVELPTPEYEAEDWNNCGPATLSMVLRYYGWEGDQYDVADLVKPVADDRNVSPVELVQAVPKLMPEYAALMGIDGTLNLLKRSIASGIPVLVEVGIQLNQAFWIGDDLWAGHYLLLTGYDDSEAMFLIQDSYLPGNHSLPYDELSRQWRDFNRLFLLVYPLQQNDMVNGILGERWEGPNFLEQALQSTEYIIQTDSPEALDWYNLGSIYLLSGDIENAVSAFDTARKMGLPQRLMRYRPEIFEAYFLAGRLADLQQLIDYALQITPNSEEAFYWQGMLAEKTGDEGYARLFFGKALKANPYYQPAVDALSAID